MQMLVDWQGQCHEKLWVEGRHWADDEGLWWTADGEKFLLHFSTAGKKNVAKNQGCDNFKIGSTNIFIEILQRQLMHVNRNDGTHFKVLKFHKKIKNNQA